MLDFFTAHMLIPEIKILLQLVLILTLIRTHITCKAGNQMPWERTHLSGRACSVDALDTLLHGVTFSMSDILWAFPSSPAVPGSWDCRDQRKKGPGTGSPFLEHKGLASAQTVTSC